jgi:hypothetical protein
MDAHEAQRLGNMHRRLFKPAHIASPIVTRHATIIESHEPVGGLERGGLSLVFAHVTSVCLVVSFLMIREVKTAQDSSAHPAPARKMVFPQLATGTTALVYTRYTYMQNGLPVSCSS